MKLINTQMITHIYFGSFNNWRSRNEN